MHVPQKNALKNNTFIIPWIHTSAMRDIAVDKQGFLRYKTKELWATSTQDCVDETPF